MSTLVAAALSYLLLYKYIALFVIAYFAALLLPLPSGTSTMAAGAFATQGYFSIELVIGVALLGNVLGDLTGFFLSRWYGREFLEKIGLKKIINSPKFVGLEAYIQEKAALTIFSSRFLTEFGPLVNILVGLSPMPFRTYFAYEFLGEFFDVFILASLGYVLGSQWQNASGLVSFVIVAVMLTLIAIGFSRSYFKALHHRK